MEGVGGRMGRSSSRYGTTTVFTGPVRKWKKDWIPITSSSSSNNNNSNNHNHSHNHHPSSSSSSSLVINGGNNGSVSRLRLYKWTPLNHNHNNNYNNNGNNGDKSLSNKNDVVSVDPPRRKFKYIPIAVLEEQIKEVEDETDDEDKAADTDDDTTEQASKSGGYNEKPDINDVPMDDDLAAEENQTAPGRQDLNESFDLSLGLTSHEDGHDSDSKTD